MAIFSSYCPTVRRNVNAAKQTNKQNKENKKQIKKHTEREREREREREKEREKETLTHLWSSTLPAAHHQGIGARLERFCFVFLEGAFIAGGLAVLWELHARFVTLAESS